MSAIVNNKNKEDILFILNNLRYVDELEAKTLVGEDYKNKILDSILSSSGKFFLAKDNNNIPYAMGGFSCTEEKGAVIVWLLSTKEIKKHSYFVLKNIKKELEKIRKDNWLIYNYIFIKNYLAKVWLKKFGFAFVELRSIPEEFELFYWKRETRGLGNASCTKI